MPFLYVLHSSLAIGEVGEVLLGVVALLWTVDCFVAAYVTFPPQRPRNAPSSGKRWLARWLPSWLVRTNKLFAFIFTWHRASGLWVWGMLLVFAWSAVGLNLRDVYKPVMAAVYGPVREYALPKLKPPFQRPELSPAQAYQEARVAMRREAEVRGIEVYSERLLRYRESAGVYEYRVYTSRDISKRYATTMLWIDGNTGAVVDLYLPTGESLNTSVTTWIYQLHFGTWTAGGWPYRVFVSSMGVAVALLSVSGLWIWWKKRRRSSS